MIKFVIPFSILTLSFLFPCLGQSKSVPKKPAFDKVVIMAFSLPRPPQVNSKLPDIVGKPNDGPDLKFSAILTKTEQTELNNFLKPLSTSQVVDSNCWDPHFGVYFVLKEKIVNYLEFSTKCQNLKSLVNIKSSKLNDNFLPQNISTEFTQFIYKLIDKYKFPKQY